MPVDFSAIKSANLQKSFNCELLFSLEALEEVNKPWEKAVFDQGKMGRRNKNSYPNFKPGICKGATLREEKSGKKHADVSLILKMKHLQKLAVWAGGEGGIPPLGALFGYQLAANAETSGVPLDQSSFYCRRCESILQPGFNCTIRIEKCKNKKRKRSNEETSVPSQNNVVYTCNFCYHRNVMKGTTKGHLKPLISSRQLTRSECVSGSKGRCSLDAAATTENARPDEKILMSRSKGSFSSKPKDSITVGDLSAQKTPLQNSGVLSNELKARRLQFSSNGSEPSGSAKGSGRRKRKAWSSLKDIVERKDAETDQSVSKLVIPFYR
ncbi:hypothetical protein KSP39_PZI010921 [Platanthera zijinensis]|uniref:Uncharacterized protein n=1 Tax=Platanthera zijinensis TaxID=2320716 RepID=A0AAP0G5X5_9ASPA